MSNREVKYLFENWRRFALSEAKKSDGEIVNIFDFDNTVISVKDFLGVSYGPSNHYMGYLNVEGFEKLCASMAKKAKVLPAAATLRAAIKKQPNTTYIFSSVSGAGFGATRESFLGYLAKGDKAFINFCNLILNVSDADLEQFRSGIGDTDASDDVDYDEGDSERYDDNYDLEESLNEADAQSMSPDQIVDSFFTFPESGEKEDPTEIKMSLKKKLISYICKNIKNPITIDEEHIVVGNNLAKGAETGGIVKGTSGKVKDASAIAAKHPDAASYRLFDNNATMLAQVQKGVKMFKSENPTPEQKEKLDNIDAQLAAAKTEKDKKDLLKKKEYIIAQTLNVNLFKVNPETNRPEPFYGATLSHSTGGVGSTTRAMQVVSNKIIEPLLGRGATDAANKENFINILKKFPNIASVINANLGKLGKKAEIPGVEPFNPEGMTDQQIFKFIKEKVESEIPAYLDAIEVLQKKSAKRAPAAVAGEPAPETDKPEEKPVKAKGTAKKTLERANKHLDETGNPLFENRLYEMVVKNLKKKGILR